MGVRAVGPDKAVDLRALRGYRALATLLPPATGSRPKAKARYRANLTAVLHVLAIPGAYRRALEQLSLTVPWVELSPCTFDSEPGSDAVVRSLVQHGLTPKVADDCWRYCVNFLDAQIANPDPQSGYDKQKLAALRARVQVAVEREGPPPSVRSERNDCFPRQK